MYYTWERKRWKSKLKLQEMMDIPENVMSFSDRLPDYDICMIDIHEHRILEVVSHGMERYFPAYERTAVKRRIEKIRRREYRKKYES
ncbi:MAG: hypothetical protein ACLTER_27095 [Ruminococcus sp.]